MPNSYRFSNKRFTPDILIQNQHKIDDPPKRAPVVHYHLFIIVELYMIQPGGSLLAYFTRYFAEEHLVYIKT